LIAKASDLSFFWLSYRSQHPKAAAGMAIALPRAVPERRPARRLSCRADFAQSAAPFEFLASENRPRQSITEGFRNFFKLSIEVFRSRTLTAAKKRKNSKREPFW
jgi:hypothetical protein